MHRTNLWFELLPGVILTTLTFKPLIRFIIGAPDAAQDPPELMNFRDYAVRVREVKGYCQGAHLSVRRLIVHLAKNIDSHLTTVASAYPYFINQRRQLAIYLVPTPESDQVQ